MARSLGSAAFALDATFKSEQVKAAADKVNRQVAEALKNPNIKVGLDTAKLDAQVKATAVKLRTLDENAKVSPELKTAKIDSELAAFKVKTEALMKEAGNTSGESFNNGVSGGGGGAGLMNPAVIAPIIAAGLAVAPGLFALAGSAGAIALGAAFAIKGSPELQKQGAKLVSQLTKTMENAASVLVTPISDAMATVSKSLPQIGGLFKTTFGLVGPEIQPLVNMLLDIVKTALPGFNVLMRDAQGPLLQFFSTAGKLVGTKLADFFAALGPGVAGSLPVISGLLNVFLSLAVQTAKVSTEIAELPSTVAKAAGQLDKLKNKIGDTGKSLNIPKSNENIFQVINDGVNWISKHVPQSNKTLLQLAEGTSKVGDAATSSASGIDALNKRLADNAGKVKAVAAGAQAYLQSLSGFRSFGEAVGSVAVQFTRLASNANDAAKQTATAQGIWTSFIGLMTSGTTNADQLSKAIQTYEQDLKDTSKSGKKLNLTQLDLNDSFDQAAGQASATIAAYEGMGAAAHGVSGTQGAVSKANRDVLASLLPLAGKSSAFQSILVALAQQSGLNVSSFGQLKGALKGADGSTSTLAADSANLTVKVGKATTAQKNLTSALVGAATAMSAQAILAANGAQGGMNKFADALARANGAVTPLVTTAGQKLFAMLVKSGQDSTTAKNQVDAMATAMGVTSPKQMAKLNKALDAASAAMTGTKGTSAKTTAAIAGDFTKQGNAAVNAKGALANYTAAIKANGLNSTAARKARTTLVNDLIAAGVNSKIANRDVDNYTSAIKHHSANSDAVRSARLRLISDIVSASRNAGQGKKDLDLFTSAVEHHSSKSDQVRSARARLIQDLVNTGLDSKTATGLVNGLQGSINALHGKTVPVMVDVGAAGTITATAAGALSKAAGLSGTSVSNLAAQLVFGMGHAAGGLIGGTGNRDTVPALLTPGEVVVPKNMVARGAVDHLRGKLPGFANGGRVPGATALLKDESLAGAIDAHWSAGIGVEFGTMIRAAFASKIAAAAKAAAKAAAAAAGSPVAYSRIAGVTQWEPDVLKVLSMLGLPQADLPTVMSQMLTESGGNPNAINLTDSNARAGTPSKGLMQVIAGTFAAYRNPSLSGNIYDPLANIYAGINYAIHRYGNPGWLSVLGHGHGYAAGGLVGKVFDSGGTLDPGANLIYNLTGKPERVTPAGNGDVTVTLELGPNFKRHTGLTDQELADIRYTVRTHGGSVERTFGRN